MADHIIVWGFVNMNAKIISGSGFRVDHSGDGLYTVLFDQPFNVLPSVVASQVFPNDMRSTGGNTRDNAVIVGIANDRFRVKVGQADGKAENRDFTFIVIGL